jgi:hypothetical protein
MLARTSFEHIRPLEPIWPSDPHLPPIIRLRPDNRDPPIAPPITEEVFNKRNNFRPHYGIARILHVYRHGHTAAVYAFHCTNLRQLTPFLRQAYVCLIRSFPHEYKSPKEIPSDRNK